MIFLTSLKSRILFSIIFISSRKKLTDKNWGFFMQSDIWAMGVCVYEMATLERPFDATLMQQLVFKIVHGQVS